MPDLNQPIIDEFRANQGVVGGPFDDARLVLLTTTGAKTGNRHTTPLGFLVDEDGRTIVIGSAAGSPRHPDWYHNVLANPRVTVETGVFTFEADAVVLNGDERDRIFARAAEADPGWAEYQRKVERVLPVVALSPVSGGPNEERWGDSLKAIHGMFRRELTLIRKEVAESGPRLGAQLRINCLTLCQGLHFHHTSEDGQVFPYLDEQHPELADTTARLRQEHEQIKELLDQLQELITAEGVEPANILTEMDRLTDELLAHLAYEEEQLIPTLNAAFETGQGS